MPKIAYLDDFKVWTTDGSLTGEAALNAPNADSSFELTNVWGTVFFVSSDFSAADTTFGLWKTDGTSGGTTLLKSFSYPSSFGPFIEHLTDVDGALFFSVNDGAGGMDLWKSNGTSAGTVKVKDFGLSLDGYGPSKLTNVGGTLFFVADDGNGAALFKSDGTSAGTVLVERFMSNAQVGDFAQLTELNGRLVFVTLESLTTREASPYGYELYTSDGTAAGTGLLKNVAPGNTSSLQIVPDLVNANGVLYFNGYEGADFFGFHGYELWRSDGSTVGTTRISGSNPFAFLNPVIGITNAGGIIYYGVTNGSGSEQIWKYNGAVASMVFAFDGDPFPVFNFKALGTGVFFYADDGVHGRELWFSNGTGAAMVEDINPGAGSSDSPFSLPTDSIVVDGVLYFGAFDDVGPGLWRSDGTAGGTYRITDGYSGDNTTDIESAIVQIIDPTVRGDGGANTLIGTTARDILRGFAGADTLIGLGLNDRLDGGDGIDTASYAASASAVSVNLALGRGAGGDAEGDIYFGVENVIGSAFADALTGAAGANELNGGLGADTLIGGLGNDTYFVDNLSDVTTEAADAGTDTVSASRSWAVASNIEKVVLTGTGDFNVAGNGLANTLRGNSGDNWINGSFGKDILTGLGGRDSFIFNRTLGPNNIDTITDYDVIRDVIRIDNAVFAGIGPAGALSANQFHIGAAAADADDHIIYNSADGKLYFDIDGTGATAQIHFATLSTKPTGMSAGEFIII